MATDPSDKHTEARVIHHDGLSRLLATLDQSSLGAEQANRLWASLEDPSRAYAVRNAGLFQDSLTAAAKQDATASSSSHLPLHELLPEWYEIHNRRCRSCQSPLLLGVNATFSSSTSHGILCRSCASVNRFALPDRTSKRALRSWRVREATAAEAPKPVATDASAGKRRRERDDLASAAADVIPTVATPLPAKPSTSAVIGTLDQRKAELRRKAKVAKVAPVAAGPEENADRTASITAAKRDSTLDVQPSLPPAPLVDQPSPQPAKHNLPVVAQTNTSRLTSATAKKTKPSSGEEPSNKSKKKDALRDALAANRKKKGSKEQQRPASSSSGGLQAFLSNL